jgi:uncharacterized SAM-binding protein YcdF (DUF218 family)
MMSFSLAELFRLFMLPPAGFFLLLALAWLLVQRWPHAARALYGSVLIISFTLCTPAGADLLVAPLENRTRALTSAAALTSDAQAIVVLAAGRVHSAPEYNGLHIPDYIALARLRYAAHLQHQTNLPILASGGNRSSDFTHDSKAASMARALREDFQTPVEWIESNSETTAQNARRSYTMLHAKRIKRILLVTDAMHMARAESMFAATGFEVIAAPTVFLHLRQHDLSSFLPSAEGLRRSYYASYEWIGLLWYRLNPQLTQEIKFRPNQKIDSIRLTALNR